MKHQISPDRRRLTIEITDEEQQELKELAQEKSITADQTMHAFLEPLTCNSDLCWLDAAETCDLTDAPILGVLGEPQTQKTGRLAGCWPDTKGVSQLWYQPVVERWAWMKYESECLLEALLNNKQVVLVG